MIAARMGHVKTVQRLLELGADVNCKEKVSYLVEVVSFWTKFGIKTKFINTHCKGGSYATPYNTLLELQHWLKALQMFCASFSNEAFYYALTILQLGPTALHFAAENGHSEIVKLLLRAGATDTPDQV